MKHSTRLLVRPGFILCFGCLASACEGDVELGANQPNTTSATGNGTGGETSSNSTATGGSDGGADTTNTSGSSGGSSSGGSSSGGSSSGGSSSGGTGGAGVNGLAGSGGSTQSQGERLWQSHNLISHFEEADARIYVKTEDEILRVPLVGAEPELVVSTHESPSDTAFHQGHLFYCSDHDLTRLSLENGGIQVLDAAIDSCLVLQVNDDSLYVVSMSGGVDTPLPFPAQVLRVSLQNFSLEDETDFEVYDPWPKANSDAVFFVEPEESMLTIRRHSFSTGISQVVLSIPRDYDNEVLRLIHVSTQFVYGRHCIADRCAVFRVAVGGGERQDYSALSQVDEVFAVAVDGEALLAPFDDRVVRLDSPAAKPESLWSASAAGYAADAHAFGAFFVSSTRELYWQYGHVWRLELH